jgi:hypothetical protein
MWCDNPKCKKEVDINSVAVSKPRGALSMDIEGDVTPTMIHSTSNIINICKSCGESDYLFDSKASAKREDERQEVQRKKDLERGEKLVKVWGTGLLISLGVGFIFGLYPLAAFPDNEHMGPVSAFFGFALCGGLLGVAVTWAIANFTE